MKARFSQFCPVILAQTLAQCRPDHPLRDYLGEKFARLSPRDRLLCRAELHTISLARRGVALAQIRRSESHAPDDP